MPIKTKILDYGNFVYSPEAPVDEKFVEYLTYADRLFRQSRKVQTEWNASPFSPELAKRKKELEEILAEYIASFRDRYTVKSVERDPAFLSVSQFFARNGPLREPFSILHCNLDMPLHTVHEFRDSRDLAVINAALDKDTPFRWWQDGPHDNPCYLFGRWVWELKPSECGASGDGIALLFLETMKKERQKRDRLRHNPLTTDQMSDTAFLPEKIRGAVWRKAGGRCAKCGGREQLEFHHIIPVSRGGTNDPGNICLLCEQCHQRENGQDSG